MFAEYCSVLYMYCNPRPRETIQAPSCLLLPLMWCLTNRWGSFRVEFSQIHKNKPVFAVLKNFCILYANFYHKLASMYQFDQDNFLFGIPFVLNLNCSCNAAIAKRMGIRYGNLLIYIKANGTNGVRLICMPQDIFRVLF